jgi:hypothetical protein
MLNAAAIAEAVTKPTMRLVQIGQRKQSAHHPLHRFRDRYLSRRVSQYAMIHVANAPRSDRSPLLRPPLLIGVAVIQILYADCSAAAETQYPVRQMGCSAWLDAILAIQLASNATVHPAHNNSTRE